MFPCCYGLTVQVQLLSVPSTVRGQRHKPSKDKQCLSCHAFPCVETKLREHSQQKKRVGATAPGPVGEWLSHIPFTDGIVGSNPIGTNLCWFGRAVMRLICNQGMMGSTPIASLFWSRSSMVGAEASLAHIPADGQAAGAKASDIKVGGSSPPGSDRVFHDPP